MHGQNHIKIRIFIQSKAFWNETPCYFLHTNVSQENLQTYQGRSAIKIFQIIKNRP